MVILNWNGEELLKKYLPSVIAYSPEAAIYVVDNGSTDGSVSYLQHEKSVTLIHFSENYGFAGGYNRAIRLIDHPFVLILNSDVRVTEGWLEPLDNFISTHPEAVAIQPKIRWDREVNKYEYSGAEGGYMDYLGYPFCRGRIFDELEEDLGQYGDEPKEVFWTSGAAMLVRRDAFLHSGGFDESFFAHQEEIDLCWRWHCEGHKLYVIPESTVYHYGGASLGKEHPRKTFLNFRNNLRMLHKLLPKHRLYGTLIARFFLDRLAAVVFLIQGHAGNAAAVLRAWWAFLKNPGKRDTDTAREIGYRQLYHRMLLWRYHVKGEKRYNQLKQ